MTQKQNTNENENETIKVESPLKLSSRLSFMIISILAALLLSLTSAVPTVFAGLFASTFLSIFFDTVLFVVDPKASLSFEFDRKGVEGDSKVGVKLGTMTAFFFIAWIGIIFAIDHHRANIENSKIKILNPNLSLEVIPRTIEEIKEEEPTYLYIVNPFKPQLEKTTNLDKLIRENAGGKLNLLGALAHISELDPFDPILVKIRNKCKEGKGLCSFPSNWFETELLGINKSLSGNEVSVCKGHDYLAGGIVNFSNDTSPGSRWTLEDLQQGVSLEKGILPKISKDTAIKINREIDPNCSSKNERPAFTFSKELLHPMKELFENKKTYARIIQN